MATAQSETVQRRVLVVDDDPGVCELIALALGAEGFEAHRAHSDREAHDQLEKRATWDALVLDVNLGEGTTGFDIARLARLRFPGVPVVYVSGQAGRAAIKAHGVPGCGFVAKPFTAEELLSVLGATFAET